MRQRTFFWLVVSSLLGCVPAFAMPTGRLVPPDSFLNTHVDTKQQLDGEIGQDAVVSRRLAKHFHCAPAYLRRYVHKNLILSSLHRTGSYRVYCVTRAGREYLVTSHLAAGTPVFVLKTTGQPVLKLACGNPMVSSLPNPTRHLTKSEIEKLHRKVQTAVEPELDEAQIKPIMTPPGGQLVDVASSDNLDSMLNAPQDLILPDEAPVVNFTVPASFVTAGASGFGAFAPLAFGGTVAGFLLSQHGSNNSPTNNAPTNNGGGQGGGQGGRPTPIPTPEPGTVGALALGAGLLGLMTARRRA